MAVSELPGNPNAVWTVKRNMEGESCQSSAGCSRENCCYHVALQLAICIFPGIFCLLCSLGGGCGVGAVFHRTGLVFLL